MIGWVIVLAVWMAYIEVEHPNRMDELEAKAAYEKHSV
jgi:hypothetical protein